MNRFVMHKYINMTECNVFEMGRKPIGTLQLIEY